MTAQGKSDGKSIMVAEYIAVSQLTRTYERSNGQLQALTEVSLTVPQGQFLGLRGHSGAGKSTLLNILGGLDRPTSGKVSVGGTELGALDEAGPRHLPPPDGGLVFRPAKPAPGSDGV